jgi:hypothetical protein
MQCNAVTLRAAGGSGNYTGYNMWSATCLCAKYIFEEKYSVIIIVVF